MMPLLGTKNPSAPAGDKSGGERRAARAAAFQVFTNHETRDTNHGFCRGATWGGYGAAWAAAVPRSATRPVGFSPATNHATCFPPALRRLQEEQLQARPTGFSQVTNHESRNTAFFRKTAFSPITALMPCPSVPTIARHCPALLGIKYCPASVSTPSAVLERPCGEFTQPSGLLGLRRRQNDAMLRKVNVLDAANRGTFYLVLTNTRDSLQPDALVSSLHFSPRGEAKCVRGPSGLGANRAEGKGVCRCTCQIASSTPRVTKHGISGSLAVRHFFWGEPGPLPWFSRITRHETRITAFLSCASTVGW